MLGETMASRLILSESNDPNNFAALLLLPFALSWWRFQNSTKLYQKIIYSVSLAYIAFFILMTGSRGGLLSVLVILISYYFFERNVQTRLGDFGNRYTADFYAVYSKILFAF